MKSIMTNSSQQYSRKVSLLSQQTGKEKWQERFNAEKVAHERIAKSTSIG